jgi:membrane protein
MKNISQRRPQTRLLGIVDFLNEGIWRIRLQDLSRGKSLIIAHIRVLILAIRGFAEDKCLLRASALTFYTLLSIVPVGALFFGIAKGFGFEKVLQQELYAKFPGQEEVLTRVINFALALLENTKGGLIAGIGLAVLFWSAIKVFSHIEAAFNTIWEISDSRSWGRKFSDYLSLMLISPILVLLSSSTTVFITTQVTQITETVKLLGVISPVILFGLKIFPYVLIWLLFTVLYLFIPNTKVKFKAGLIGGLVAGTLYQLAQLIYINFQFSTTRYNAIYGSFAALPLFLMWVQISWFIVLFGAELSFASQNVNMYLGQTASLRISPRFKKLLTLQIAHLLIKAFAKAEKPLTAVEISRQLKVPLHLVHDILQELVQSGLFSETKTAMAQEFGYQPGLDTSLLTIQYIMEALERNGDDGLPLAKTEELATLTKSLEQFSAAMEKSPGNKLLRDI